MTVQAAVQTGAGEGQARAAWATVFILMVLAALAYMDRAIIALLVEPIRRDLQIGDFQISLLQGAAFAVVYAVFGVPMGWLVDRFPRRTIIFLGVAVWSLAATACGAFAKTYPELVAARIVLGIGEAALGPAAYSLIGDLFPKARLGLASSVYAMGTVLGAGLAITVGGGVIAALVQQGPLSLPVAGALQPWQMAFVATGLPGLFLAPLIFLVPEPERRLKGQELAMAGERFLRFLTARGRYLACHFVGFGVIAVIGNAIAAWFPVYLQRRHGLPVGQVGLAVGAISALCGLAGYLAIGWTVDRLFARGWTAAHLLAGIVAAVGMGVFGALAFSAENLTLTLICYGIAFFLAPVSGAAVAHLQITTPPPFRGRVSALYLLVFTLMGFAAAPSLVAFFTDFVFRDPQRLGTSVIVTLVIAAPTAVLVLAAGLAPASRAVGGPEDAAAEPAPAGLNSTPQAARN